MVGSSTEIAPMRGFALSRKLSAGGLYPTYLPYDSNRGWHGEWFYIRNLAEALFPAFTRGRPEKQDSWSLSTKDARQSTKGYLLMVDLS